MPGAEYHAAPGIVTQPAPYGPLAGSRFCVTLFLPGRRGVLILFRRGTAAGPPRFVLVVWPAGAVGAVDDLKGESLDGPPDGADDEVKDYKEADKENCSAKKHDIIRIYVHFLTPPSSVSITVFRRCCKC